jgi:hypothetical protein
MGITEIIFGASALIGLAIRSWASWKHGNRTEALQTLFQMAEGAAAFAERINPQLSGEKGLAKVAVAKDFLTKSVGGEKALERLLSKAGIKKENAAEFLRAAIEQGVTALPQHRGF